MKTRSLIVVNLLAAIVIIALIVSPVIGFILVALALITLPPWGRGYAQRGVISGLVLVGVIALVFPRAGSLPIDQVSASMLFGGVLAVAMLLRLIPVVRKAPMPRVSGIDVVVGVFTAVVAVVPIHAYWGTTSEQALSALFQTGWDNQGHFVPFSNTVMAGSAQWVSVDGSVPWNQWYPAVHTNLWSLTQVLVGSGTPDRISLVIPYAILVALSFAAAVGVLIWISGDLAKRLARNFELSQRQVSAAGILAALATGLFGVLGTIQFLYSAGFTNFVMAVAVVSATSYLAATNPVRLGWFVLPLGALAAVGLWTPLVLALVPAGLVVAYSLVRTKIWLGITWFIAVGGFGLVTVLAQADAVLGASDTESATSFNEEIGGLGAGMTGFNLTLGIAAPFIAVFMSIVIWKKSSKLFALLLPVPVVVGSVLALVFVVGADGSGVSRLTSYYVLKSLNANYLFLIPLLIAAATLALIVVVSRLSVLNGVLVGISAIVIGASTFGYIGFNADKLAPTFTPAPGIAVAQEREFWINNPEIGIAIAHSARVAQVNPEFTPLVWEGVGILQNLWVLSLTGVVSSDQSEFYGDVSVTPYGEAALTQIAQYIYANPLASIQILWWTPEIGAELQRWVAQYPEDRLIAREVVLQ
jgi:hypothetical protein